MTITHEQARIGLAHLRRQERVGVRCPADIDYLNACPCIGGAMLGVHYVAKSTSVAMSRGLWWLAPHYTQWALGQESASADLETATFADAHAFLQSILATAESAQPNPTHPMSTSLHTRLDSALRLGGCTALLPGDSLEDALVYLESFPECDWYDHEIADKHLDVVLEFEGVRRRILIDWSAAQ